MSRGPLEVLMDSCRLISIGGLAKEAAELREAIAQVEALVKSARLGVDALERVVSAVSPDLGVLLGDRAMFLRDDLKPFTPGQDSEGGGHG